jgi:hypothetical protein
LNIPIQAIIGTFLEMAMASKYEKIYRFKISLNNIKPLIWRCIEVPENYSFWDLHVAIQDAMGWLDCHLHEFKIENPVTGEKECIGIPDEDFGFSIIPGWETKISDYFSGKLKQALYIYDFGDNWEHCVHLEKVLLREADVKYPRCIDGKRACPPEDCGSIPGYKQLVKIMKNAKGEEYESMLDWLGFRYDPEAFSIKIGFSNPKTRLKNLSF